MIHTTPYRLLDNIASLLAIPLLLVGSILLYGWNSLPEGRPYAIGCLLLLGLLLAATRNAAIRHADRGSSGDKLVLARQYYLGKGVGKNENEAFRWAERAANQGDGQAQFYLGLLHESGMGTPRNLEAALDCYHKAAESGFHLGWFQIGALYEAGDGCVRDPQAALKYFRLAAERDVPNAFVALGCMYANGNGVLQDLPGARSLFEFASAKGLSEADWHLARLYYKGDGVEQSLTKALALFKKAARNGSPEAQFDLGRLYYDGHGVHQSQLLALHWLRRAARGKDLNAQVFLGRHYLVARRPNHSKALAWLELAIQQGDSTALALKAIALEKTKGDREQVMALLTQSAESGNPLGMFRLAEIYMEGELAPKNEELAIKWCRASARTQFAPAEDLLGCLYLEGIGLPQNPVAAQNLFERSAKHGDAFGAFHLAEATEKGIVNPPDLRNALYWYMVAERRGATTASDANRRIRRQLSEEERKELKSKVDAYLCLSSDPLYT